MTWCDRAAITTFEETGGVVGFYLREVAVFLHDPPNGPKVDYAANKSAAAKKFSDKYDLAVSSASSTAKLARWIARIDDSDNFKTSSHVRLESFRAIAIEVDYPTNEPSALASIKGSFDILNNPPTAANRKKTFYADFVEDYFHSGSFVRERDAIDADPAEPGGAARRQPYLYGLQVTDLQFDNPEIGSNDRVRFLAAGNMFLRCFEHRSDDPTDPTSWTMAARAPVDPTNPRQFRRIG